MESEPMLTPRKNHRYQRKVKPVTLHDTGQWAQHTTKWAVLAHCINTSFLWNAGSDFDDVLRNMSHCPSDAIRWCVISEAEKLKCESMLLAFKAKDLKPDLDCLYGGNTTTCMEMIRQGDADLINLDAADVYIAGRWVVALTNLQN